MLLSHETSPTSMPQMCKYDTRSANSTSFWWRAWTQQHDKLEKLHANEVTKQRLESLRMWQLGKLHSRRTLFSSVLDLSQMQAVLDHAIDSVRGILASMGQSTVFSGSSSESHVAQASTLVLQPRVEVKEKPEGTSGLAARGQGAVQLATR